MSIETGDVQSKNAKRIPFFYIHLLMPRIVNGLTVLSQSTLNFFHYENSLEEAFMKVAK